MSGPDLGNVFTATRDDLQQIGITDKFFLDLLASRLVIERAGEGGNTSANAGWWDSLVLSPTGRDRLKEVTPKTHVKARLDLALKVGRKAESDRLPADSVSLFSFGPRIETRLTATIDDIATDENVGFEALENVSDFSPEEGWTNPLLEEIQYDPEAVPEQDAFRNPEPSGVVLPADETYTQSEVEDQKRNLLATFLRGYGSADGDLSIPYYPLEAEIATETA